MVARLSVTDILVQVRDYLDTDELNLPNALLDTMLQRVWFEALQMEREWRFFNIEMTVAVPAGTRDLPMAFAPVIDPPPVPPPTPTPASRINYIQDPVTGGLLPWVPAHEGTGSFHPTVEGGPVQVWTETSDSQERVLRLFPTPSADQQLIIAFYAIPVYPALTETFAALPQEFDQALKTGLLAEAYLREEDPELYDAQRQVYLNAMGSIREAWRESDTDPLVMNQSPLRPRSTSRGARPKPWPGYPY